MEFKAIQPMSFRLIPDRPLLFRYHALAFPQHWKEPLRRLQAQKSERPLDHVTVPVYDLNMLVRALVPDVLFIAKNAAGAHTNPWLYSSVAIDSKALLPLVHAWLRTTYQNLPQDDVDWVAAQMRAEDLGWREHEVDVARWATNNHGTATPEAGDPFLLLPNVIASHLSRSEMSLAWGNQNIAFRRAPLEAGIKGAELVSWPPLEYIDSRSKQWRYSVLLTATVQTIPFQAYPVINVDVGVRRWISSQVFLPRGTTSVYLLTQVPWINGLQESQSFQVAPLTRIVDSTQRLANGKPKTIPIWARTFNAMLDQLNTTRKLPDPINLTTDPIATMNLDSSPSAAIAYATRMRYSHGVAAGWMPHERVRLFEQLELFLASDFLPVEPYTRIPKVRTPAANDLDKAIAEAIKHTDDGEPKDSASDERRAERRRQLLRQAVGDTLHITIRYANQGSRAHQALLQSLSDYLGLPAFEDSAIFATPELTFHLRAVPLGVIGSGLLLDTSRGNTYDQQRTAISERISLIRREVFRPNGPALDFVELDGPDAFAWMTDPKQAMRVGLAHQGRLSQFIQPEAEPQQLSLNPNSGKKEPRSDLPHRSQAAVLDGLRQLGVVIDFAIGQHLPADLNIAGCWLLKQNRTRGQSGGAVFIPTFVMIDQTNGYSKVVVKVLGSLAWLSYREALLALATKSDADNALSLLVQKGDETINFIQKTITEDLNGANVLLLADAINARLSWKWLTNTNMQLNRLLLRDAQRFEPGDLPGLRVLRLRHAEHETPEWYAPTDDGRASWTTGVFEVNNYVFASLQKKSKQALNLHSYASKSESWFGKNQDASAAVRDSDPELRAWNPGFYEITAGFLQPGDVPMHWAQLVHNLRASSAHYTEATALPLPLHLARLMNEYILNIEYESPEAE